MRRRAPASSTPGTKPVRAGAPLLALAVAITAVALSAGGCATGRTVNVPLAEAHDLTAFLGDRDSAIHTMKSAALMEYTGSGEHFKARENIVVRRPASMRVEVMSALGVALVIAADGGHVAVFNPEKNTLTRGIATAETLKRYARIPMTPDAAVRLMLGLAPDSTMLAYAPASMTEKGDGRILTYRQPGGVVDQLGFDGADNLVLVRETRADGRIGYEVHYADYRKLAGGYDFPTQVDASFPRNGVTVKIRFENPSVNQDVPDSTFVLAPGPGTRKLNLGMDSTATSAARG